MQAVRLKLAGREPKVIPPDEAQCVWQGKTGVHQCVNTKVSTSASCDAGAKPRINTTDNTVHVLEAHLLSWPIHLTII